MRSSRTQLGRLDARLRGEVSDEEVAHAIRSVPRHYAGSGLLMGVDAALVAVSGRTDNFNRADSSSALGTPSDGGSNWVAQSNTWGISSNQGYVASGSSYSYATLEASAADVSVQVTLATTVPNDGTYMGLCARLSDTSNFLWVMAGSGGYELRKRVAGSETSLGSSATSPVNGDVLKLTMSGSSLTVYVNGVSKITATESFNSTATQHGLISYNASTARKWDDFSIA